MNLIFSREKKYINENRNENNISNQKTNYLFNIISILKNKNFNFNYAIIMITIILY